MKNLLVKNVRIVDAHTDMFGQVEIRDGLFHEAGGPRESAEGFDSVIDGGGNVLMPAFTDLHAHFRDPGLTDKEDIESGSRAAVKGGYTTVVLMANTKPVCSAMETVNYVINRAKEVGLIDAFQVVSVTDGMKGESLSHLNSIDDSVRFISDDGKGVMDDVLMEEALRMSADKNFIVISHAEDHRYSASDMRVAENSMTERDIAACLKTGGRLHLAHVSTEEAIRMVTEAKKRGARELTCEVMPHHIYASDDVVYRVNPPLRKSGDILSLIGAIRDGYVDAIGTDHAPHTAADKANGAPGISGIETAFQLCFTKLVKERGDISLSELSALMSYNPSKIAGVNKGLIKRGYEADFVIADVNRASKIDAAGFASKGKNTPFDGEQVFGSILMTFKKGNVVYNKEGTILC